WMVVSAQFSLLAWVAFITWGAYFLSGITSQSAIREAISFTAGIIAGAIIILANAILTPTLGANSLPVVVGVAGFIIILLELVPWFNMAPGYFLGAAAFFAAGAKPDLATLSAVWIPGMLGLGLGILTAYLRALVFKFEGVVDPLKNK
ncbi:MAG: DUF1097 domain-containing protein, partial [Candidatus Daviesbacteria bacterium]